MSLYNEGVVSENGLYPGQKEVTAENFQKETFEKELRRTFHDFDADGSGTIDLQELQDAMMTLGVKCTKHSVKKILALIDLNSNGLIEWEEFNAFFGLVKSPAELRNILAKENRKFMDYRVMVEQDAGFARKFAVPPSIDPTYMFSGHNENVEEVVFIPTDKSKDFTKIVSVSLDKTIKVWDFSKGKPKSASQTLSFPTADQAIYCMKILPRTDDDRCIIGLGSNADNLHEISLCEACIVRSFQGPEHPVYAVAVDPKGRFFVSGCQGGEVMVHMLNTEEQQSAVLTKHDGICFTLAISDSGTRLASAGADGEVVIMEVQAPPAGSILAIITEADAWGVVYHLCWRGNTELFSCGEDYCIKRWDITPILLNNFKKDLASPTTTYLGHTSPVRRLIVTPDARHLISASDDGAIRIWVIEELEIIKDMQEELAKKVDAARKIKLTGGIDDEMHIEELKYTEDAKTFMDDVACERRSLDCIQARMTLTGHNSGVRGMDVKLSPDGKCAHLITAGMNQQVGFFKFELPDPEKVEKWAPAQSLTRKMSFAENSERTEQILSTVHSKRASQP